MSPTVPDQRCGFLSGEPPVAGLAPGRERRADHTPVKTFLCKIVDCGTAAVAAVLDIGRTGPSIDRRQFLAAPKIVEPFP
jgi:hypothetical protein